MEKLAGAWLLRIGLASHIVLSDSIYVHSKVQGINISNGCPLKAEIKQHIHTKNFITVFPPCCPRGMHTL